MPDDITPMRVLFEKCNRPVGVDEVGRGAIAGPLVAVACFIPYGYNTSHIRDSKVLSPKRRLALCRELLLEKELDIGIGLVSHSTVDDLNIRGATKLAFSIALSRLQKGYDFAYVDGDFIPDGIDGESVIGGDNKIAVISAASILAKCYRDSLMEGYHVLYPFYGFDSNKGYPTKGHYKSIMSHGISSIHRYSFRIVP